MRFEGGIAMSYGPKPKPAAERFEQFVDRSDTNGCHVWTGHTTSKGYGYFRIGSMVDGTRTKVYAHRFAYELVHGPLVDLHALHGCDNPACVRVHPDHVHPGTNAENVREMVERGRHRYGTHNNRDEHGRFAVAR